MRIYVVAVAMPHKLKLCHQKNGERRRRKLRELQIQEDSENTKSCSNAGNNTENTKSCSIGSAESCSNENNADKIVVVMKIRTFSQLCIPNGWSKQISSNP